MSLTEEYTDILEAKVRKLEQELQSLREQEPVAITDESGALSPTTHGLFILSKNDNLYSAPVPASEGYVLVPIEPTRAMIYCFDAFADSEDKDDIFIARGRAYHIYKLMLAAAQNETIEAGLATPKEQT